MVLNWIVEQLPGPLIWVPFLLAVVCLLYSRVTAKRTTPKDLPWIGKDSNKLFAELRAQFSSFNNVHQWLREGYEKYSKEGKAYIFPDFSGKPEVIVPSIDIRWLLDQPDNILSTSELHNDILAGPYAFTDPRILKDPFHEHVIHRYLARRIACLIPDLWDEVSCALEDTWGMDTENWKEICVFENMMNVVARVSNRVFIGLPLCRNQAYLRTMGSFAQDIMTTTIGIQFVPKLLAPIFGRLLAIPNNIHHRQSATLHLPIIKERLANIARKHADPNFGWEEPNDYLSWHIRLARTEDNMDELDPERISRRLLPINFAAIHTTTFTITNTLFDLLSPQIVSTDPSMTSMDVIRAEARRNYLLSDGTWSKHSLACLVNADSAIRESMRVSNFLTRGLLRKVVAKDGLENKRGGWRLPYGAYVGIDVHSVMHDPEIYSNAESYDAFRFAREREAAGDGSDSEDSSDRKGDVLESRKLSLSTTSGTFLPFGHGRHACPGRFLVSHELKMILAYATMFYEIEPLETRPPNNWFGQHVIPPMKATIRIRRRKVGDVGISVSNKRQMASQEPIS